MKKYLGAVLLAACALPSIGYTSDNYAGVQYAQFTTDDEDIGQIGLSLGHRFTDLVSVEGNLSYTVDKADLGDGFSLSSNSISLYGVFQSQDQLYAKAKIGVSKVDFDMKSGSTTVSDDATGLAFGVGLGYEISKRLSVELEYTRLPDLDSFAGIDTDIENDSISIGLTCNF